MSFYPSKGAWGLLFLICVPLLVAGYFGYRVMTSVYKQEWGNGVVIRADEYVQSGDWVFDCEYGRLVSRRPLPVPIAELERVGKLDIGQSYLKEEDRAPAREALKAITGRKDWYRELRYAYSDLEESVVGETSSLKAHRFTMLANHRGRTWEVDVWHWIGYGDSEFSVYIEPYDEENHVDHARALKQAAQSCPAPQ